MNCPDFATVLLPELNLCPEELYNLESDNCMFDMS